MFDFNNRNSNRCVRDLYGVENNSTVGDLAAAVFKEDTKETLPEKATICSTIYADLEDCDMPWCKIMDSFYGNFVIFFCQLVMGSL